jgi:hypothetical protein
MVGIFSDQKSQVLVYFERPSYGFFLNGVMVHTYILPIANVYKKVRGICADATEDHYLVSDPSDCHKFYSCVFDGHAFIAYHFTCPANLAFHPELKRSDGEEFARVLHLVDITGDRGFDLF